MTIVQCVTILNVSLSLPYYNYNTLLFYSLYAYSQKPERKKENNQYFMVHTCGSVILFVT